MPLHDPGEGTTRGGYGRAVPPGWDLERYRCSRPEFEVKMVAQYLSLDIVTPLRSGQVPLEADCTVWFEVQGPYRFHIDVPLAEGPPGGSAVEGPAADEGR